MVVDAKKQVTLVSVTEYCKEHGIDKHTCYKMIKDGRLTLYKTPSGKSTVDLMEKPTFLIKRVEKKKNPE